MAIAVVAEIGAGGRVVGAEAPHAIVDGVVPVDRWRRGVDRAGIISVAVRVPVVRTRQQAAENRACREAGGGGAPSAAGEKLVVDSFVERV